MKRKIKLIALLITITCTFNACQKDETQNPDVIDLNLEKAYSDYSEAEKNLFLEARNRMDSNIEFRDEQYHIKTKDPLRIGISKKTFDYFLGIMNETNSSLKKIDRNTTAVLMQKDNSFILLKKTSDKPRAVNLLLFGPDRNDLMDEEGGINKVNGYWWGYEVYLSNSMLNDLSNGAGYAAGLSTFIPNATLRTAVSTILMTAGSTAAYLANHYSNGVILTVVTPLVTPPIPTDIKSQ
ncbi:hypothetical protein ACR777_01475 [Sphingobacterium spiritivorum]|uniref:hypothetical protein n=1 Tax=Sphingobacterium spiritivorum TaxID=258 RepID=UPI003DA676D4